jgi:hypothetical protein
MKRRRDASSIEKTREFSPKVGNVKVKVEFNLEQATKAQRGSTEIALLFP